MEASGELGAVDAHAHAISADVERYPPKPSAGPEVAALTSNAFSVDRLLQSMQAQGVAGALLVQRGQVYGDDNSYVCDAAQEHSSRLRAVCGIDAKSSNCGDVARSWIARGAIGFRLMQQDRSDVVSWLGGRAAEELWKVCADHSVPLCVHFFPWNRERGLATLNSMMVRFPRTTIVVDHLSNASIDNSGHPLIDDELRSLADKSSALVKLTAIPLGRMAQSGIPFEPLLRACCGLFGYERLLWGSDISQSPGTYAELMSYGHAAVAALPHPAQRAILSENTVRTYRLEFQNAER